MIYRVNLTLNYFKKNFGFSIPFLKSNLPDIKFTVSLTLRYSQIITDEVDNT